MSRSPDNLRGIAWILISVVGASLMALSVRGLSEVLDSRMIVMLRGGILSLMILPLLAVPRFRATLSFSRPGMHLLRGVLIGVSTHMGFYTLAHLPIATASVLFFTAPIFATILSALWLGESVGPRRWAAVMAGFLGAVIILRPGFAEIHPAMFVALGSSALFAVALTLSRGLAQADGPVATYVSSVVLTALVSLPLAAPVWDLPPSWIFWGVTALLVLTSFQRGFSDIQAYRFADAAVLAPITYLRLVILALGGYLIWGEVPDIPTITGAAVIVAATLYITRREAVLRRRT